MGKPEKEQANTTHLCDLSSTTDVLEEAIVKIVPIRTASHAAHSHQVLCWLGMIAMLCPLFLAPQEAWAQAGARPGDDNPAVVYSEWRDDEFFTSLPVLAENNQARLGIFAPNSAMTTTVAADQRNLAAGSIPDATVAAAGRILSPNHESIVYAQRSGSNVGVSFFRPDTPQPVAVLPDLAGRVSSSSDFLDVAAGDLDGTPADDTEYRDEVVVVYAQPGAGNQLPISVAVLDFAGASESAPAPTAVTTALSSGTLDAASIASGATVKGDGGLDSAVGDYDGDGADEIVIAYLSGASRITIDVFRYALAQTSNPVQRTLTRTGSTVIGIPPFSPLGSAIQPTVALVMADFDGDNLAEGALATSLTAYVGPGMEWGQAPLLYTFDITGANPAAIRIVHSTTLWMVTNLDPTYYGSVQLAAGLFKVDPGNGWGLNRRQLALAFYTPASYNGMQPTISVQTILIGSDLSIITNYAAWGSFAVTNSTARFALAAGGYGGATSSNNPNWYADLLIWDQKAIRHRYLQLKENSVAEIGTPLTWTAKSNPAYGGRNPLVAIDYDGDTAYLGAPVHLVVENLVSTDFILQEPPKHAYWDAGLKTVANVSRVDGFNISLAKSDKEEFSSTSKDTTDWSIGSSASASASETVGANINGGIAKESMELTVQATAKVGYDYQEHESDYTSSYADRSVSFTGVTSRDDYIVGKLQTLDVWRYRMFGMQASAANEFVYYEIVMPGPYQELQTSAGGMSFDWYQPVHENGNLLSYPQFDNTTFTPADLGTFTLPGSDTPVRQLLLDPSQRAWDATSDSIALNFSSASGGGSERSYSHTLSENASIKATYKSSSSFGGPKNNVSSTFTASGEVELHNKNSWGNSTTSNNKTTSSTGITLNKPTGSAEKGYYFYPVMYVANDGTIKATYAVDPLSHPTGKFWWIDQYGQQPDLALNLPLRFTTTANEYGVVSWTPTKSIVRKQMRGFFVRKAELNPVTGEYDLITNAVLGGSKVRLEARVYNYSLSQPVPTGAVVRFEAAPYDPNTNKEGARFQIGETTLPLMEPRRMLLATVVWDTATIAWDTGTEKHYRIYVVLDPDDQVKNEKYETESAATQTYCYKVSDTQPQVCIDPGQNNEGFGYVTVKKQLLGDPNWHKADADLRIEPDGLRALDPNGNLVAGRVQAAFGQPLDLRITVHSDVPSPDFCTVLLYDGDPAQGGRLLAGKKVFAGSVAEEGSSAWLQWVPDTGGTHNLYAKVLQSVHDPVTSNNISLLQVEVQGWAAADWVYMPIVGR